MHLDLLTPEQRIYSGETSSVSLPGSEGRFQVLHNHAPLIAALKAGEVRFTAANQVKRVQISGGLVEVLKNRITVLAESASPSE
ncbi:MAG: ATP synthase F1 subunit epsilon [Chitinophagales bacterium]|nr:ATP synthase F1 subunit epsilon [Chitinophagales bacterium]